MQSRHIFITAFVISLGVHASLFLQHLNFNFFPDKDPKKNTELRYLKEETQKKPEPQKMPLVKSKREIIKIPDKVTAADNKSLPQFLEPNKENRLKIGKDLAAARTAFEKPVFVKPDIIAIKKRITLPPVNMDKINNPSYISYYQIIREKIRRAAYQNYSRTEVGEVFVSFLVLSDGQVKEVRVSNERSSASHGLKEIAQRTVQEASPFPVFPKELDYNQLPFSVIISFEME